MSLQFTWALNQKAQRLRSEAEAGWHQFFLSSLQLLDREERRIGLAIGVRMSLSENNIVWIDFVFFQKYRPGTIRRVGPHV